MSGAPTGTPPKTARLDSLTSLRWLAALLVFAHHIVPLFPAGSLGWVDTYICDPGSVGVSFFLMLSGFVITWVRRSDDTVKGFWTRRFARIYPSVWLTWLIALPLAETLLGVVMQFFLVQAWIPDSSVRRQMNSVTWALSVEVFFYAVYPFLSPRIRPSWSERPWLLLGGLTALIVTVQVTLTQMATGSVGHTAEWLGNTFPPVRFLEFLFGCALALCFAKLPRIPLWPALIASFAAMMLAGLTVRPFLNVVPTLIPFALTIVAAAQRDLAGKEGGVRRPWLLWLGGLSYAFFLLHNLMISYIRRWGYEADSVAEGIAMSCVVMGIGIALAWAMTKYFENPSERWVRRRLTPRPQANP